MFSNNTLHIYIIIQQVRKLLENYNYFKRYDKIKIDNRGRHVKIDTIINTVSLLSNKTEHLIIKKTPEITKVAA